MKFSEYFSPTLKDEPADAEIVSHKLMIRSGMIPKGRNLDVVITFLI